MDEKEWLKSDDPRRMVRHLTNETLPVLVEQGGMTMLSFEPPRDVPLASDRKLRLFAVAGCRAIWEWLTPNYEVAILEVAEWVADGALSWEELAAMAGEHGSVEHCLHHADAFYSATSVINMAERHNQAVLPLYASILRDIVGNRWGVATQPGLENLLTDEVVDLAAAAYENRLDGCACPSDRTPGGGCLRCHGTGNRGALDPFRLSLVADALEEAGCWKEADLLDHLRGWEVCPWCWEGGPPCEFCHDSGRVQLRAPHYRGCWALDCVLGQT